MWRAVTNATPDVLRILGVVAGHQVGQSHGKPDMLRNEFTRHILPSAEFGVDMQQAWVVESALVEIKWRGKAQLKQFVLTLVELGRLFVVHRNGAQSTLVAPVAKQHMAHAQHQHTLVG